MATKAGEILNSRGKVLRQWREAKNGALRVRAAGRNRMVNFLVLSAFTGLPLTHGYRARNLNGDFADNGIGNLAWASSKKQFRVQPPALSAAFEQEYDKVRLERLALVELMQA